MGASSVVALWLAGLVGAMLRCGGVVCGGGRERSTTSSPVAKKKNIYI